MKYVTAYEVTRHYGGPEEGGWWYDWYHPIETVPTIRTGVVKAYLQGKYEDRVEGDRFSVLGGTAIAVAVEDEPCELATTERPFYC